MSIFRLQNNTPDIYVNKSRDFQLLCRAFDCINAGVRYNISGVKRVINTDECINRMLALLQTKLGFFTKYSYNDDDIRAVLKGFPEMVKRKGTVGAIEEAIRVFLRISRIDSVGEVILNQYTRTIQIGLQIEPTNVSILDEMLRYIIPTGYFVEYYFYGKQNVSDKVVQKDSAYAINTTNGLNSQLADQNNLSVNDFVSGNEIFIPIGKNLMVNAVGLMNVVDEFDSQKPDFDNTRGIDGGELKNMDL